MKNQYIGRTAWKKGVGGVGDLDIYRFKEVRREVVLMASIVKNEPLTCFKMMLPYIEPYYWKEEKCG